MWFHRYCNHCLRNYFKEELDIFHDTWIFVFISLSWSIIFHRFGPIHVFKHVPTVVLIETHFNSWYGCREVGRKVSFSTIGRKYLLSRTVFYSKREIEKNVPNNNNSIIISHNILTYILSCIFHNMRMHWCYITLWTWFKKYHLLTIDIPHNTWISLLISMWWSSFFIETV